jgi:ubiquitin carboxyl-terminal hydrolase L5
MSGGNDWCTIESDPGVFTEMLETLGCTTVELEELWSLDDDSLQRLGKVLGMIFLFQYQQDDGDTTTPLARQPLAEDAIPPNVFFAQQVITNACATQAILSVVFNAGLSAEQLGPTLSEFQNFTSTFPPNLKGIAIGSSDEIRTCHNSFGRPDAFLNDEKFHIPTGDEEAYHFIAYVPIGNTVYELDGLQSGPIVVGTFESETDETSPAHSVAPWLDITRNAIQERMQAGGDHIKFNLMAVLQDQRVTWQEKLATLEPGSMEHSEALEQLTTQNAKRDRWRVENQRRRHNFVPLCMQLIKEIASLGNFQQTIEDARKRYADKRQKRQHPNK